ncbi:MAG: questin oxidase family protein [Pseudomonadales bacterium]
MTMTFDPQSHGLRYASEYPPHGFSNHLPMAWQALGALGADGARREAFVAAYLPRLQRLPEDAEEHRRVSRLLAEIRDTDVATVVRRYLPGLISGWYREAYHPLIRLAYGIEFAVVGEVAAALAYLQAAGPCPRLAELAQAARPRSGAGGLDLLRQAEGWHPDLGADAGFGVRAAGVLAQPEMARMTWTLEHNVAAVSRAALDAFAATHDFFALHLLTGSHAFRLVRPYLDLPGPVADAMLNLGLLAGYVVIGAPPVPRFEPPAGAARPDRRKLLAWCRDDEHDLKVAYSASAQAEHWQDAAYAIAAAEYLRAVGSG